MSAVVLDCSAAMGWCFEDDASPESDALLDRVVEFGAVVPALWRWEVANVLVLAARGGRISQADAAARLRLLEALPIALDGQAPEVAWRDGVLLAQAHRLTVYDAAYLELALRTRLALATKDADLIAAATTIGLPLAL